MSHRRLALVSGLTVGDYLLWNWSLSNGHDVPALIAGLSLLPLGAASVWLLALTLARLLARAARRGSSNSVTRRATSTQSDRQPARGVAIAPRILEEPAASPTAASAGSPSRKLAA